MNNKTRYITEQGKARLESDLLELETIKLPLLLELVPDAAQGGASAENSEMQNLQNEREMMAIRINTLRDSLENVTIINTDVLTKSVHIGSTVLVQEKDEEMESYMIVGSAEADPAKGMISNLSPLGEMLLGKREGEDVCVKTALETIFFRIIKIQSITAKRHYASIEPY